MLGSAGDIVSRAMAAIWQGGPVMFILALISFVALTIIIAKIWQFRSRRVGRRKFIAPALRNWRDGDHSAAAALVAQERSPIAKVMYAAMQSLSRTNPSTETVEAEITRSAMGQIAALDTGFRALETISILAPLMGILGTALSLMGIGTGGAPSPMSAALVATVTGICISMIVVVFYYWLDNRVERERRAMEAAASAIIGTAVEAPAPQMPSSRYEERDEEEEIDEYEYEYDDDDDDEYYEPELR